MSFTAEYIPEIRQRLLEAITTRDRVFDDMVFQPFRGEGKMVRPRMVLLSAGLFGPIDEKVMDVAVAVECIHTASLVHDDVIDEAWVRRGVDTASHLFGNRTAILLGDHLFATAFYLMTRNNLTSIVAILARAISEMCQGEIRQDTNLFNPDLSYDDYFLNIFGKTASLFSAACRCGALASGASAEDSNTMALFGENLGYAYQIADDLLDLFGSEEQMGKPAGSDLLNGVITLPVIYTLMVSKHKDWLRSLIVSRDIDKKNLEKAILLVQESGAIKYSLDILRGKISHSMALLERLPLGMHHDELFEYCLVLTRNNLLDDRSLPNFHGRGNENCFQTPGFTTI